MKQQTGIAAVALALGLCSGMTVGCGSGTPEPQKADPLAVSDPNAKARALLEEFAAVPEADRQLWISDNTFPLAVFEAVTDPELKAHYQREIAPLRSGL